MVEYTAEELEELRTTLGSMGGYLPKDKTGYIWNNYKRITNSKENQPCTVLHQVSYGRKLLMQ